MNVLTFDIEDWFHILDFDGTENINSWNKHDSRLEVSLEFILSALSASGNKASFFILGWIAEKYPAIVKKILEAGHEIGCHSFSHLLIYKHSPEKVKNDFERSMKLLQDISGNKIKYFRAPGFSITEKSNWAFDILVELGIEVDSSIFPASRGHGGYENFPYASPCNLDIKGSMIKELPINTVNLLGKVIVFSGGGYFRMIPYPLQKMLYNKADYVMTYFHPRDFDPGQPVLENLSFARRFRSYVGLKGSKQKFNKLLTDFKFVDIKTALADIEWNNCPTIKI